MVQWIYGAKPLVPLNTNAILSHGTLENGFVNQDINQHTYLFLSLICLSFPHARLSNTLLIVSFYSVPPQAAGGPVPQPMDGGQESRHAPEM